MTKAKKWLLAFWVLVGLPGAWMAAVQAMLAHRLASDPILRVAIIPGAISIYDEYVLKRTLWGLLSACLLLAPLLYIIAQRLTPAAKGALTQLQQMTASKPASAGAPRERFVVSRPILAGAGTTGVVAVVAFLLWTSSGPSSDEVAAASAACEGFYKEERLPNYDYVKANGAWTKSDKLVVELAVRESSYKTAYSVRFCVIDSDRGTISIPAIVNQSRWEK